MLNNVKLSFEQNLENGPVTFNPLKNYNTEREILCSTLVFWRSNTNMVRITDERYADAKVLASNAALYTQF